MVSKKPSLVASFPPFYSRFTNRWPGPSPLLWKVLISVMLGAVFFAAQVIGDGERVFRDWIWLLHVLIATAMLLLYFATYTLGGLFPHMDSRLAGDEDGSATGGYVSEVIRLFRDRNFVLAGTFFGVLNCAMGWVFGVPGGSLRSRLTLFAAFFVVGFICGMAAFGIFGVLHVIKAFMRSDGLEKDYAAPDQCGGMLFLGEALVKFSSVTLIQGVLIAIFIVRFPWTGHGNATLLPLINAAKWFWIAFPFFLSLLVLLAPATEINRVLTDYKVEEEDKVDNRIGTLRRTMDDLATTANDRDAARKDYEYYSKVRAEIYKMRTWPFGLGSSVQYGAMFVTNAGAMVWQGIAKLIQAKTGL